MAIEYTDTDNDGIDVGDPTSLRNPTNLSWCAWIYPYSFGTNDFGRIWQKFNIAFLDDAVSSSVEALACIRYRDGVNDQIMRTDDNTISLNEWQLVGAVHDASAPFAVINGVEPAYSQYDVGDGAWTSDSTYDFVMGNRPGFDRGFDGLIEDLRIYHRLLSIEEMKAIYELRGTDNIIDGLAGRWTQTEKPPGVNISTDAVVDISENRNDGLSDGQNQDYAEGYIKLLRPL